MFQVVMRFAALLVLLMPALAFAEDDVVVPEGATVRDAPDGFDSEFVDPIFRQAPLYPENAVRRGIEGWVVVSFTISEKGEVEDVKVIDSSNPVFHKTTVNAVRKWKYKPRRKNGVPVRTENMQTQLTFELGGDSKSSKEVRKKVYQIEQLIKAKDYAAAEAILDQVLKDGNLTNFEVSQIEYFRFMLAYADGKKHLAWIAIDRAAGPGWPWLTERSKRLVVRAQLHMALETNRFVAALRIIKLATKFKVGNRQDRKMFSSVVSQIDALRAKGRGFVLKGVVDRACNCGEEEPYWTYRPLRRHLGFRNVSSNTKHLQLRCEKQWMNSPVFDGWDFKIPEQWGQCKFIVSGEHGATFDLIEY